MINTNVRVPMETIERFNAQYGIGDLSRASQIFDDVVAYLDKGVETKKSSSPTKLVDEAWHHFILDSRKYTTFCNDRYGTYIHHIPTGMAEDSHKKQKMQLLLNKKTVHSKQDVLVLADCNDGTGDGACSNNCGQSNCNASCNSDK